MVQGEITGEDRAHAAVAGMSPTPATTPPGTPARSSSISNKETTPLTLPLPAYYIIFVEGCERFCYYGLKAILLLYFMQFLQLNKDSATVGYHLFSSACYFTPVFGAIISDGFIGRYWTILSLSIVYFLGTFVLSITAIPSIGSKHLVGPILGLLLIGFGTGGIKPCVSSFGADQISMANTQQLNRFFAFFYFAINLGSFVSTLATPALRSKIHCFGYDCYSLAFAVPSILMLIAIVVFIIGTPLYKRVPPKENAIAKFLAIVSRAIRNTIFHHSTTPREHWLYRADDKYSAADIEDVRSILHVCLLFVPIPVFHALMNQSGSRWTYQASLMDGSLGVFGTIQPDQMQASNPLLILILIPLFEKLIYPLAARCNLLIRPLQRMFVGMLLMVSAFIVAAILQRSIQTKAEAVPVRFYTNVFNGYNCNIILNNGSQIVEPGQIGRFSCLKLSQSELLISSTCNKVNAKYSLSADEVCPSILIVTEIDDGSSAKPMQLTPLTNRASIQHGLKEFASLRMVSLDGRQKIITTIPNKYQFTIDKALSPTEYKYLIPDEYEIKDELTGGKSKDKFQVWATGVYTALLYNTLDNKLRIILFEDIRPFTVHILWQSIQYILMTAAEVLVSITGLMFAYSQASKRYKAVVTSVWLLTVAFGDLIVVLVAETRLVPDQTFEFLLFAFLMAFATFIFGVLGINYKHYQPNEIDSEDQQLILERRPSDSN